MRINKLTTKEVEYIPEHLSNGILYVSLKYKTAIHKCCCGCGSEVVTPLSPTDWKIRINAGRATLTPSIGNWSLPCQSHYWIKNGQIEWSYQMSQREIHQVRQKDVRLKKLYFEGKPTTDNTPKPQPIQNDWIGGLWQRFVNWLTKGQD